MLFKWLFDYIEYSIAHNYMSYFIYVYACICLLPIGLVVRMSVSGYIG